MDEEGFPLPEVDEDMFWTAREGDTNMVPFQCDLCHFRNLQGRDPVLEVPTDNFLMKMIRRANLDAFWSRTSNTVSGNYRNLRAYAEEERELGLSTFSSKGPFPLADTFGMGPATVCLKRSLRKGRNSDFVQYKTVKTLRSSYSNLWNASINCLDYKYLGKGVSEDNCPTNSFWFKRFMKGFHSRVGDQSVTQQPLSKKIMGEMMSRLDKEWKRTRNSRVVEFATYILISYLGGLRGNETTMVDLGATCELLKMIEQKREQKNYVALALRGKFKCAGSVRTYLCFLSNETKSNFDPTIGEWLTRLLRIRKEEGRTSGWLFYRRSGPRINQPLEMSHYDDDLHKVLIDIQRTTTLIDNKVKVEEAFGCFRSARRGATTEAKNAGVAAEVIEENNNWRKEESARGRAANTSMLLHYTEESLSVQSKLRFSASL